MNDQRKRKKNGLITFPSIHIYIVLDKLVSITRKYRGKGRTALFHGQSSFPTSHPTTTLYDKVLAEREKFLICHAPRFSIVEREPINDDFRSRGPTLKNVDQREQCHGTQRAHKLLRYSKNFNYTG